MREAPLFRVAEVEYYERPVRLRLPFRFGVVTLTEAPQAFVRARIECAGGRSGWGAAAEMLAPKWFDKNPALSHKDNIDQLRQALWLTREAYLSGAAHTAFGHFATHYHAQITAAAGYGLNPLVANFGPALLDRALLDALCKTLNVSFYQALQHNIIGLQPTHLLAEFKGFDMGAFLRRLQPATQIQVRHTVGLVDVINGYPHDVADGLPESLQEVIAAYGPRWFKLKVSGDVDADVERLQAIAVLLDASGLDYRVSLDGNEQYEHLDTVMVFWQRVAQEPSLQRLVAAVAFIEQPISRVTALNTDVRPLSRIKPVIIDESDADLDSFPRARTQGYQGISSKSCKGLYKSIINAARCQRWQAEDGCAYWLTGEDLTTQAGLAVQQDLALANALGISHIERNGHHYVNGMADLPQIEQQSFLAAHPDLYHHQAGAVRLNICHGQLAIGSLSCPGFASVAEPLWDHCCTMPQPAPTVPATQSLPMQ